MEGSITEGDWERSVKHIKPCSLSVRFMGSPRELIPDDAGREAGRGGWRHTTKPYPYGVLNLSM